ncbi:hypothetical protein T281_13930 [Rhodomicrobium udaipurense JA643]|nr:hypothetical protein T281_13930 [Rhodomicrobium udaipurense JA643]
MCILQVFLKLAALQQFEDVLFHFDGRRKEAFSLYPISGQSIPIINGFDRKIDTLLTYSKDTVIAGFPSR